MDLNDLRSLTTVLLFGVFLGICVWAYSRKNRGQFDDAAQLPFIQDEFAETTEQRRHA